jgi:ribosomal protein S27AE
MKCREYYDFFDEEEVEDTCPICGGLLVEVDELMECSECNFTNMSEGL